MFFKRRPAEGKSKKQLCIEFYNSWEWPKVWFETFYQIYRKNDNIKMEEAITPRVKTPKKDYSWPWGQMLKRYDEHPLPKTTRELFRMRLRYGYPKEEAILMWDEWVEARERKAKTNPTKPKWNKPKRIIQEVKRKEDPNDYKIEITYPKDIARIFRKEYQSMIEEIEWELENMEEKSMQVELNKKLVQLNKELLIFNCYNK